MFLEIFIIFFKTLKDNISLFDIWKWKDPITRYVKGIDCESVFIDTSSIPELQEYTISLLKLILESSLLSNGSCYIAVSGSSQPKLIGKPLSELNINWKCVYFFFVDERCVSIDDPDSSFRAWDNEFFSKVYFMAFEIDQ